jgi:hypothetical protein
MTRRRYLFLAHLYDLVIDNYQARQRGELPDEWCAADVLLLRLGFAVDPDTYALRRLRG